MYMVWCTDLTCAGARKPLLQTTNKEVHEGGALQLPAHFRQAASYWRQQRATAGASTVSGAPSHQNTPATVASSCCPQSKALFWSILIIIIIIYWISFDRWPGKPGRAWCSSGVYSESQCGFFPLLQLLEQLSSVVTLRLRSRIYCTLGGEVRGCLSGGCTPTLARHTDTWFLGSWFFFHF